MGLLEKKQSRMMTSNVITRVMNYRLTDKGRLVAQNLSNISKILAPDQFPMLNALETSGDPSSWGQDENKEIDEVIMDCIEIGLESFGMNLDELVRAEIEKAGEISWDQIAKRPEKLQEQLLRLFGAGGSSTIESMIAANIKSRFGLSSINSDRISALIAEIHLSTLKLPDREEEYSRAT